MFKEEFPKFSSKKEGAESSKNKAEQSSREESSVEEEAGKAAESIERADRMESNHAFIERYGLGDLFEGVDDATLDNLVQELMGVVESKTGVDEEDPKELSFLKETLREKAQKMLEETPQEGSGEESLDEKYEKRREVTEGYKEVGANDPRIEKDAQKAMDQIEAMSRKEENEEFIERFELRDLFEGRDISVVEKDKCVQELNNFLEKKKGVDLEDPKELEMMKEKLRTMAKGYLDNLK